MNLLPPQLIKYSRRGKPQSGSDSDHEVVVVVSPDGVSWKGPAWVTAVVIVAYLLLRFFG